jgi:hypothetical protein
MGTGGPFPGGKVWPGRDADHSPPSSADPASFTMGIGAKAKAVPLFAMEVLGWRGGVARTHSRP